MTKKREFWPFFFSADFFRSDRPVEESRPDRQLFPSLA